MEIDPTKQNKMEKLSFYFLSVKAEFFLFLLQELVSRFQNATDERMTI